MKTVIFRTFVIVFAMMFFVSYANADNRCNTKEKITNEKIIKILKDNGYGNPEITDLKYIYFKSSGFPVFLKILNSGSLYLRVAFSKDSFKLSNDSINEWNGTKYSTKAFKTKKGIIVIDSYLQVCSGLENEDVETFIATFTNSVSSFFNFLNAKRA